MAVSIRLQRRGATHRPFYHVVATDARNPRDGRYIERLGYYDPAGDPSIVELKGERVQHWYSKGAAISNTVARLCKVKEITLSRKPQQA